MPNINLYSPQTGRRIKEDNSIVNTADMIEAIYNALVVNKNAGMQLSGSIVPLNQPLPELGVGKVVIDTLLNAVSVAAGGSTGSINLNITNEKELWLAVSIDQQPWTLVSGVPWMVSDSYGSADTFFPRRQNETKTYLPTSPALSLSLGLSPTTSGLSVTTMAEAKQIMLPPFSGVSARIVNNSAATATVTVKAIRVWR